MNPIMEIARGLAAGPSMRRDRIKAQNLEPEHESGRHSPL